MAPVYGGHVSQEITKITNGITSECSGIEITQSGKAWVSVNLGSIYTVIGVVRLLISTPAQDIC